jgi:mannosyl-oligosaccharide alpha-1,2-mannosidase
MGYEHGIYIKGLYPTEMDPVQGRFKDGKRYSGTLSKLGK